MNDPELEAILEYMDAEQPDALCPICNRPCEVRYYEYLDDFAYTFLAYVFECRKCGANGPYE